MPSACPPPRTFSPFSERGGQAKPLLHHWTGQGFIDENESSDSRTVTVARLKTPTPTMVSTSDFPKSNHAAKANINREVEGFGHKFFTMVWRRAGPLLINQRTEQSAYVAVWNHSLSPSLLPSLAQSLTNINNRTPPVKQAEARDSPQAWRPAGGCT